MFGALRPTIGSSGKGLSAGLSSAFPRTGRSDARDERQPALPISLRVVFHENWFSIATTYVLFNFENLLRLAQPLVLGWAINGLLSRSYVGLACFIVQHVVHALISSLRQMYDTRVFGAIYSRLATGLVMQQREQDVAVSRVSARSSLSRGYIEFFERHVPMLIRAIYSIVGALIMLGLYDWTLIFFCLGLLVPAALINVGYGRRAFELNSSLHDQFECEVDVIEKMDENEVRNHYDELARWRVRLSDAEALNFGLMELFVLGLMVACLVQFCTGATADAQPGDIFAVFRYVLMFVMGLDSVPRLVEQMSRLKDIGGRLKPAHSTR